ncbi:MAG: chemotaxis protein CheW [Burkholderiales bacterium]|nr:MAG: chemotaxis protein CheW [Burkholderiales bacterium]
MTRAQSGTQSQNLREFQARLAERLRQAAAAPNVSARLGLQIGEARFLVELSEAGEILPVPPITPVPLTRDWFKGVVNLRGTLHSVIDLQRFMGLGFTPTDRESRLVAFGAKVGVNAGVVVSRMLGLRNIGAMQQGPEPAEDGWLQSAWIDSDGATWRELSLIRLARDERFMVVGR